MCIQGNPVVNFRDWLASLTCRHFSGLRVAREVPGMMASECGCATANSCCAVANNGRTTRMAVRPRTQLLTAGAIICAG
jgi:hypothetical protein